MKKWFAGSMLMALFMTYSFDVSAVQPLSSSTQSEKDGITVTGANQLSSDAFYIMNRTTLLMNYIKKYTDANDFHFELAKAHQEKARIFECQFAHFDAIYHSLRARELAFRVIVEKGAKPRTEYLLEDRERRYLEYNPSDEELDRQLVFGYIR
jgi:hypothetical protein